ncbi:MAG: Hsp20/alpha crystallin family protein [Methanotrichaceae archaeon]|nr:Hsp20/alpha crystallin family protein [Methanotrichaceae archaeon]
MHNMICEGLKGITTSMYMVADDLGLIDTESMYAREMRHIQEKMGKLTEAMPLPSASVRRPLADVMETDDEVIVTLEVPGVEKEDIDISLTDDELYVRAKKAAESEEETECVHKMERSYEVFKRTIKMPVAVKGEQAKATLNRGVLKIVFPKEIVATRTKIPVEETICE